MGTRCSAGSSRPSRGARRGSPTIPGIRVLDGPAVDPLKLTLVLPGTGADGIAIENDLLTEGLPVEAAERDTIVAQVSLADTDASLGLLVDAIIKSVKRHRGTPRPVVTGAAYQVNPVTVMSPRAAFFAPSVTVALRDAVGQRQRRTRRPLPTGHPRPRPWRRSHRGRPRNAEEGKGRRSAHRLRRRQHPGNSSSECAEASASTPPELVRHVSDWRGGMADRRRLSPEDRRSGLLALGAEVFGQRPYDEVRIDEIAERAGVSRALMYHYFPDKRAFFAAVVRAEGERLFQATNTPPPRGLSLFDRLRAGVLAYLGYDEAHPHGAWAANIGMGRTDPVLRGIDEVDNERQAADHGGGHRRRSGELDATLERDLRVIVYGWLAFTFELCRQRILDPSIDAGRLADACAHALLDAVARVPGIPPLT